MFVELTREWMGQKAGAIIDLADGDAKLLTDGGVAKAVTSDPLSPLITKAMGAMLYGMQKAVDAASNKAFADLQASQKLPRGQASERIFGPGGKGDPDHCFGDWALQVAILGGQKTSPQLKSNAAAKLDKDDGSQRSEWSADTQAKFKSAIAEGSGVTGGYSIPPQFYYQMLGIAAEETTFRPYGFVQPMASAAIVRIAASSKVFMLEIRADQLDPGYQFVQVSLTIAGAAVQIALVVLGGEAPFEPAKVQDIAAVTQSVVV